MSVEGGKLEKENLAKGREWHPFDEFLEAKPSYRSSWPYLEGALFVCFAALINIIFFPESPGFKGLPFSILWIPIILIAGKYGTIPAIFTAMISGCYYFYSVSLGDFLLGRFDFAMDDKVAVFVFFLGALFIGQVIDRAKEEAQTLRDRYEEIFREYDLLKERFHSLERVNQELEKRIVGKFTTLSSLYEIARELESLEEENLFRGIMELLRKFLQADRACIYLRKDDGKVHVAEVLGYAENQKSKLLEKAHNHPMIRKAFTSDHVVTFREGFHDQVRLAEPIRTLLVAPIRIMTRRLTIGVISVDRLPFLSMNASNVRALAIIADWAARGMEKSQHFARLKAREINDKSTLIYTYAYFSARMKEELSRAIRHNLPLTLVLIKFFDFDKLPKPFRKTLITTASAVFRTLSRDVDVPCHYSDPSIYALILPLTDTDGGEILTQKIRKALENYAFKPFPDKSSLHFKVIHHSYRSMSDGKIISTESKEILKEFLLDAEKKLVR